MTEVPAGGRRRRLTVRAQLTLWSAGIVAVALTLFGVGLRYGVERILIGAMDRRLEAQALRFLRHPPPRREAVGPGPDAAPPEGMEPQGPPGGGPDGQGPPEGQGPPDGQGAPEGRRRRPMPDFGEATPGQPGFPPAEQQAGGFGGPPDEPSQRPSAVSDQLPLLVLDSRTGQSDSPPRGAGPWSAAGFEAALHKPRPLFTNDVRGGRAIRVYSFPFTTREGDHKIIQTATATNEVDAGVAGVTSALLLLIPAAVLMTAAGGVILANRVLQPVGRLATAAGHLQATELSARLPGDDTNDEFGRLTSVLNGMLARLEAAFTRQKRFAADASHELRTPLATIKAQTSLALDDDKLTLEEARESLQAIDRAADRAERLVRDLLLLVKAGALPVRRETFRLTEALGEAVRSSRAAASAQPQARIESLTDDSLLIATDRDHLLRLIGNLIDNAVRHTPPEGSVTVRAVPFPGGGILVSVTDTGIGISPEHLARLGEPFYRVDSSRNRRSGGTGLGLAICFGLAEALGGTLRLESEVGRGTTAFLTLPG